MSDQPNLLLCCFDLIPGPSGLSRRITEYLRGMSERFQVVVLSAKTPDVSHIERFSGARLLRVPVGTGDLASRIQAFDRAVRRQMESEEFYIVHCFDPFGGYALCELKNEYGYRFIYDASSFPSHELRWTHPDSESDRRFLARIRRQELYCLMNADAVITGSETTKKYIASMGVADEAIRVLPAPVDLTPFTPAAMGKPDASPMKLIYLGSQLGYQGLATLLRAMQLALRQTDVRLSIVGPRHPEWQPPLEDLVEELKLKGKVEFQPPVGHDDLHKIIALADAGAAPLDPAERNTVQGGALSKIAEYLAGGRPVIASDLEVTRELVPEGAGVFFPAADHKALSEAIVSLANHPEQRVAMGEVGAEHARARFDGAKAREALLELYAQLQLQASQQVDDRGEPTRSAIKALKAIGASRDGAPKEKEKEKGKEKITDKQPKDPGRLPWPERGPALVQDDDGATTAITDPASAGHTEPPVVMGLPLRDDAAPAPAPKVELPPAPVRLPFGSQARAPNPLRAAAAPAAPPQPIPSGSQARAQNPLAAGRVAVPISAAPPVPTGSLPRLNGPAGASPPLPIPTGSQARAPNPLGLAGHASTASQPKLAVPAGAAPPPPIPSGSQARAQNPLAAARAAPPAASPPPPIPPGSQARAQNPLLGRLAPPVASPPAPIPTGSQARARNPLGAAPPLPSGSLPRPRVATPVKDPDTPVQPSADTVQTDKRVGLGTAAGAGRDTPIKPPRALKLDALAATTSDADDAVELDASDDAEEVSGAEEVADADEVAGAGEVADGEEPSSRDGLRKGAAGSRQTGRAEAESDAEAASDAEGASDAEEVSDAEVMPLTDTQDEDLVSDEPPEAEADALESDSQELEVASALDPWLAQLVHGWCPPESALFSRLPPPTTFPGRENPPPPSRP